MPQKIWTLEADFEEWTLSDLAIDPAGTLVLDTGCTSGTATLPPYEVASWQHWGRLQLTVSQPVGTNVYLRWRSGTSSAECLAADWSPYVDAADASGVIIQNLRTHYLNNPAEPVGAWIQLELTLEAE